MWALISNIGSILTILGVGIFSAFSDGTKAWISVGVFACLAIFGGIQIYRVSFSAMNRRYPKGYVPISSSARFTTSDGIMATYEVVRHIQVKQPVMTSFEHKFFWSGSKDPRVESDIQVCGGIQEVAGDRRKVIKLKFPQARIYNDVEIIHMKMALNDSDRSASPRLSLHVDSPIRLVNFRVELLHRVQEHYLRQCARVSKTPIENINHAVEDEIAVVNFDGATRSFSYQILNPEPGYVYKIEWERDSIPLHSTTAPTKEKRKRQPRAPEQAAKNSLETLAPQHAQDAGCVASNSQP